MGSAASPANTAPHSGTVVHTNQEGNLRPTSELLHITCADDLPYQIMADSYDKLASLCRKNMSEEDRAKVERAYCFAAEKHAKQKRRSGEMYINHPVEVAIILAELNMDCDVVCAALLHDTVEDTETSLDDVANIFGPTVSELVDGVTKLTNIEVDSMDEKQALNLRKMFLAMSRRSPPVQGARDDGRVRAFGRPPGYELHQVGAGGPLVLLSRAGSLPAHCAHGGREP